MVGITYFGGAGSIIKNNDIHNLYFGFYSNGGAIFLLRIMLCIMDTTVLIHILELMIC